MKCLSASIIVLARTIIIASAAGAESHSSREIVLIPGWGLLLIGVVVWLREMQSPQA